MLTTKMTTTQKMAEKAVDLLKTAGVTVLLAGIEECKRGLNGDGVTLDKTYKEARKMIHHTAKLARKRADQLRSEVQTELIEPVTDRVERAWHELSVPRQKVPTWARFALGSIGAGAVLYGLSRTELVRDRLRR